MSNEKQVSQMMSKLARMALVLQCKATAGLLTEETPEDDQKVVDSFAAALFGACGLVAGDKHPETIPTGEEVLDLMKLAMETLLKRLQEAALEAQAKAMQEEEKEMLAKCKVEEPAPSSAPVQEEKHEPEESTIPEFKGMSQEEIAASMEKIFGL